MIKVLVTGSRELTNPQLVNLALTQYKIWCDSQKEDMFLILGDCPTGADKFALDYATKENIDHEVHFADWASEPRAGGVLRNQRMVNSNPEVAFGFLKEGAGNRGTSDCLGRCTTAGIPTKRIWEALAP